MKKLMTLVIIGSFLTACSSSSTNTYSTRVDNYDSVVVEGENFSITNQDLYEYLMDSYGADYILDEALRIIADDMFVDQDEIDAAVQEIKDTYINVLGDEEAFNNYVVNTLKYSDVETYTNEVMIPSAKQNLLSTKYVTENYQSLAETYYFKKIKLITFDTESAAYEANTALTNGEITFDEAFEKYNTNTSQTEASLGLVSTLSTDLDSVVSGLLSSFTYVGYYGMPVTLSDDASWAVIYIEEIDVEAMKDEIISTCIASSTVRTVVEAYYLKQYNFDVLESTMKKQIQSLEGGYLEE